MAKELVWSPLALQDFNAIIQYLELNWSSKVALHFIDKSFMQLDLIIANPKQFPLVYKTKKYRKCVLTKHNTMFYKEKKNEILLLRIFDTRQHPNKINLE